MTDATPSTDRTCRGWADIDAADRESSARLARELQLTPRGSREPFTATADKPGWPGWAIPLGSAAEGCCETCGEDLAHVGKQGRASKTGLCGKCGHRLGGVMRGRVKVALRLHRERMGTP